MALIRTINTTAKGKQTQGFTLIEVLIAGLLLAVVMIAVSNFSTTALSNSSKQSKRIRIETAINENMQLVHQADSILTLESIPEESRIKACSNPAEHLKTTIESPSELAHVPAPVIIDAQGSNIIQRTIETGSVTGIMMVTYVFDAPEQNTASEKRMLELAPNFQAEC